MIFTQQSISIECILHMRNNRLITHSVCCDVVSLVLFLCNIVDEECLEGRPFKKKLARILLKYLCKRFHLGISIVERLWRRLSQLAGFPVPSEVAENSTTASHFEQKSSRKSGHIFTSLLTTQPHHGRHYHANKKESMDIG